MGRYGFIGRRLLETIPVLLGVVLLVFLLLQIAPGDPARTLSGPRASEAELDAVREDLGLNESVLVQYVNYVGDVATGDLGTSISRRQPVTEVIADALPLTLLLLALGALFSAALAVPLAFVAARKRDQIPDHVVRVYSITTLTMPSFWVGILLLILIALPTGIFPVSGYGDTLDEHLRALVLPALTLAIATAPLLIRSLRTELIGVRESDYISMARACGISGRRLILRHELPNVMLPAITILAVEMGYLLFGVVVVEEVFSLPGLGSVMATAVDNKDFPVIQGITLVFALLVVAVYLIADILYTLIDPRLDLR